MASAASKGYGTIQSDEKDIERVEQFGEPAKEDRANWLSVWFFFFVDSLIWTGYKRPLEHTDMPAVAQRDDAAVVSEKFERMWAEEMKMPKPSLVRALRRAFGFRFMLAGIPKLMNDLLGFVAPLAMGRIITWLESTEENDYNGYIYAAAIFIAPFLQTIFINQYFYITFNTGMQVRTAIVSAVLRKTLRLSPAARMSKTQGEIVNMQSNDTQRLMDVCPNFHLLWSSPLQIIIALVLLVLTLGDSAFVGAGIMILLIPLQGVIAAKLGGLRKRLLGKTDLRVKLVNEIFQGIRVIKYYAWEQRFADQVKDIRQQEVEILTSQGLWRAYIGFFLVASPVFVSIATFAVYSIGNLLTPEIIFPALSYFNLLRFPLTFMPILIISLVECNISVNRLYDFLMLPELEAPAPTRIGKVGVRVTDGTFNWDLSKPANPSLRNINMEIGGGELVMVVGPVGAGKTSLLSALLGSISRISGQVDISGTVAYAPQQAWIMNKTVRDNILFNKQFSEERYRATVHASCLKDDFKMLPAGDSTEIGEKGINLSGGQKQRIALARAVYADADIYIMDDVLSAVDAHVGKHIFEECIMGELREKTRIFVTHQNQFLPHADRIIVMHEGTIIHQGTYSELTAQGVDFAALVEKSNQSGNTVNESDDIDYVSSEGEDDKETDNPIEQQAPIDRMKMMKRTSTLEVIRKRVDTSKLVEAEERETGVVKGNVYWKYIVASGGGFFVFLVFLAYVFAECVRVGNDLWLSLWSTPEDEARFTFPNPPFGRDTQDFFLWMYVILGLGYCIVLLLRNIMQALAGIYASRKLHNKSFENVMHTPVSFFDVTPIGRVLNRFTKDLDNVDNLLPQTLSQFLGTLFTCISTLIVIVCITYWFLLALIPIMILYYMCMQYYRRTSRELQRLDSISRSPIFSHFSETLSGADVIRAFNQTTEFIEENERRVNYNQRAYWMVQVTNRWLSLRLEILGSFITFGAAIFAVVGKGTINAALAGLSITYALQVTGFLNFCVRMATQTEAQMNAVERILSYADLENEADWVKPNNRPPPKWPANPEIIFKNVYMRYRPGLEPVLRNVSLTINPREKIGFVGRTGAGKSSMMLVLFRMIEVYEGSIIIDGQNIKDFGLHDLRSRLAIIPQDPVLFSGTVRTNLDPFYEYTDAEIWEALDKVKLIDAVKRDEKGLEAVVAENGANWSVGQRQLFCFARAILKKTKILVMDEATSSVDMETDALIQRAIRTEFADRTVLTIAHRLATVMDSDRVVVMSEGRVVECASPKELIHKPHGVFSSMVNDTGAKSARFLRLIADGAVDIFGNVKDEAALTRHRSHGSRPSSRDVVADAAAAGAGTDAAEVTSDTPPPTVPSPAIPADPFGDEHAVQ